MKIRISDVIKEKRRQLGVSQEVFAEVFGVSVQAVSKWETQSSMPDIALLPKIAEYLHISMDELFFGTEPCKASICSNGDIPDDGKLRIVQYKGNTLLNENEYDPNVRIMLEIPKESETKFDVQIWGSADIKGDINGNAMADGMINCGNIGQSATADGGINCGNIGQSATADGNINCGNIGQSVNAAGSINCGNIGCDANAGNDINCGDIGCDAVAQGGNIRCNTIQGDASCGGDIIYEDAKGNRMSFENIRAGDVIPDDGRIRIVQYEGKKMLTKDELDPRLIIPLKIPENRGENFGVEVWGNAKIDGNIGGDLNAGGNADCLSVAGNVSADGNVRCETVGCDAVAGNDILYCGIIGVDAAAGRDISCSSIGGDANAGRVITCGDIKGDVSYSEK